MRKRRVFTRECAKLSVRLLCAPASERIASSRGASCINLCTTQTKQLQIVECAPHRRRDECENQVARSIVLRARVSKVVRDSHPRRLDWRLASKMVVLNCCHSFASHLTADPKPTESRCLCEFSLPLAQTPARDGWACRHAQKTRPNIRHRRDETNRSGLFGL